MGAGLATHRLDSASVHWPLLREYLGHSVRSLSECASIFLGRSANGDDDEDDEDDDDSYLPSAYPRYLTLEQFEEVFGLLVADARPHFAFFQHATGGGANAHVACAHHVFCGLALLARADLHAKVQFLLRLYATDAHGQLPTERRRLLLRDFLATVPRVFGLAEPIENHIVSYLEKELIARDDAGLWTCRELYDFCFTTARISGFLHEVQLLVNQLALLRDKHESSLAEPNATTALRGTSLNAGGNGRLKLLNRGATMLQLPHEALLWSMRAQDLPWFWRQDHVVLPDDTLVRDALRTMKRHDNASAVLVVSAHTTTASMGYTGFLTLDNLLCFLVGLLPEDAAATPSMGEYMRAQVAKAGQLFAHTSLRVVLLATVHETPKSRSSTSARSATNGSKHHCVGSDECFFNVLLRLACGAHAVAVLATTPPISTGQPRSSPSTSNTVVPDPLLGRISILDILEWLLGDLSLLNGKERFAVASFPWFYYTPATLVIPANSSHGQQRPWLLDAVVAMRTQRTTGLLVTCASSELEPSQSSAYVLSAESIREVFAAHESLETEPSEDVSFHVDALSPLQVLRTKLPHALEPACFVQSDDSLAHVVAKMVGTHSRRVYIKDPHSDSVQGAIRATDILRLLLQEQHRKPRRA